MCVHPDFFKRMAKIRKRSKIYRRACTVELENIRVSNGEGSSLLYKNRIRKLEGDISLKPV